MYFFVYEVVSEWKWREESRPQRRREKENSNEIKKINTLWRLKDRQ